MEISCEEIKDGIKLVKVNGSMDVNTSDKAQEEILKYLTGSTKMLIDLSGCSYVSSSGLRVLLITAKKAKSLQAKLVYAAVTPEVQDVLEMTGFIKVLECVDNVEAAITKLA